MRYAFYETNVGMVRENGGRTQQWEWCNDLLIVTTQTEALSYFKRLEAEGCKINIVDPDQEFAINYYGSKGFLDRSKGEWVPFSHEPPQH